MDLSKLGIVTNEELNLLRNNLVTNLFNCETFRVLNSVTISLTLVLTESLKREFLTLFDSFGDEVESIPEEEQNKKSYSLILKYVQYWNNAISCYQHSSQIRRGSYFNIDPNYFYSSLKANNPHMYSLLVLALEEIYRGEFQLKL